jgi:type IV pilus assembly protein PilE
MSTAILRRSARNRRAPKRYAAGVSLMELMVVIVVIGVLAGISVPAYRQYMMRTHRTEAKSALLRLAAQQERFYLQFNTYTNNLVALGFPAGTSENGVYTLAIGVATPQTFQATATPTPGGGANGVNQTADAKCASFTLNAQGVRTAAPNPEGNCW